ncbi:trigger factor [Thiorhodovibrio frisius]|uniref:Trigger factor n=1 Tax=Thiorhodovibrio frisius TaxID=631362 RepID=H8YZD4_9GAMM|nr:trigger factor [Thiorhodovibrio frisius]EIC22061.1 trigger factor [Thiorhodovibrio frisius]WPL24352.1 Trigger factor [Thiorhodovibrio frisius]
MQVSVQAGEGLKREMRVDLLADDIEAEIDKRLQRFARSARVPGFRPGKVPVRVLRQQYGDQVRSEVFGEMVQSTFPTAVEQEDLKPAGMPSIEPDIDQKARRYAYTASFEVFPAVELKPLADAKIKRPVAEIADTDVDQMIERLRQQRCEWIEVERGARKGDQVGMAFKGTIDGEAFDGGTAEDYTVEIGADRMIAGFEDELIGAAPAQAREFDLQFPEDYHAKHLAGKQVHFEVKVHKVAEPKLPEVDADFIKSMGVASGEMADFRTDVRETMERELRERVDETVKSRVFDALIEANPTELPQSLIDQEARAMQESFSKSTNNQPLPFPASFFLETARRRVATGLLINEVVKHHALSVSDDAVRTKLEALAAGYEQPQEVINYYLADKERLSQIRASLLEGTVVAHLLEEAQVEDEPKTFFELTETGQ